MLGGTVVPPGMLVAGIPAKVLRLLTQDERQMVLDGSANYRMYVQHYRNDVPEKDWDVGSFAGMG